MYGYTVYPPSTSQMAGVRLAKARPNKKICELKGEIGIVKKAQETRPGMSQKHMR